MKKPHTGGEIDAYCTKCRLDLNHRIVAMVGDNVKQVECLTCRGTHLYRRPMSDRTRAAASGSKAAGRAAGPRTTKAARETAAALKEREMVGRWEKSIAGRPPADFRAYRATDAYREGELVRHSKFGDGVIERVIDRAKVEVLFQDGRKVLAQALQAAP